ncbi:MAG: hypothetical protein COA57_04975 [Flavobacteriales bacterium]|nr:MAG: hypothetical protein COA57_04975 [Flavobacteriales bacterium]
MNIKRRLQNYMPYMAKFGIRNGIKVAKTLFPKKQSNKVVSIQITQCKNPVHVRLGTTDVSNFHENFLHLEFPLPEHLFPKLIIDAGANAGYASLYFLNKFPTANVIAIEPEKSNFEILTKNCSYYKNFKGIKSAIWIKNGYLKISNPEAGHTAFQVIETTKEDINSFPAITIEQVLNDTDYDRIDILKIDIEGTEKELFEGNHKNWIDKVDVLIIELHDRFKPGCALSFYSAIEGYDFIQYSKCENLVYIRKNLLKANTK